jgi:2-polyprenyl-3-methyl-5-hydroxy-6-metoxy-1,4-benzoquinol methylase
MTRTKMTENDPRQVSEHFAFGANWAEYAKKLDENRVLEAQRGLTRLLGENGINSRAFLDIGCGSGAHALAAIRLGAKIVLAVDIDADSVTTTRNVLETYAPNRNFRVEEASVFDMTPEKYGGFDIVYSWGVLHHTGAMFEAVRRAAALVNDGGVFAFALYRRTSFCWFWKREKKWYAKATPRAQKLAEAVYVAVYWVATALRGRSWRRFIAEYPKNRGMDFYHDVHDWLGGYPYESISPDEVEQLMQELGFTKVRSFVTKTNLIGGIFGSGCDEFVYRRQGAKA